MGNDPPQFSIFKHGRRSCAATCQITRGDGEIIDICMVVFGWIALVSLHARGSPLTVLQTAGAFVCAHDYRTVRTAQAAEPLVVFGWIALVSLHARGSPL